MTAQVRVHVTPRAGRDEIAGWRGAELSVRVTSPPEGGKANAAVCRIVAKALGIPKTAVSVAHGESSRHKTLLAEGVTGEDVRAVLGEPEPGLF